MKFPAVALALTVSALGHASLNAAPEKAPATPSRVAVEFVAPEKFTDFSDSVFATERTREHYSAELSAHLADLGRRFIAEGQRLEIRFIDIDLAGDFEPWRGPNFNDIRIVKDIYPPRMTFEYRLVDAGGAVIRQGSEKISDLAYLMSTPNLQSHDQLRYDKQLLTDWMRREFKRAK
jgi:hypothetical protein